MGDEVQNFEGLVWLRIYNKRIDAVCLGEIELQKKVDENEEMKKDLKKILKPVQQERWELEKKGRKRKDWKGECSKQDNFKYSISPHHEKEKKRKKKKKKKEYSDLLVFSTP